MSTDSNLFERFGNKIPAGEIIFKEGDEGDKMYIIQQGKVKVSKYIDGKEHILAVLDRGDFFGETAIVVKSPRTATVSTVTEVELLAFNREGFAGMIEKNSKIALNVIDKLCRRLMRANQQIQFLVNQDEKGLVATNLLFRFKEDVDQDNKLPYTKTVEDVAQTLMLPPDSVKKIVAQFEKSGSIIVSGDDLILKDMELLHEASK